ncbi:hypothetical protein CMV_001442 [Castanea mollissima]|uniref:Uncharacterized protein n=1 Tax=Castanea mollissima TaxID=60419 RepID=A0A8J4VYA4_9ROSI|nr:hypothetical protein CMV_001442 [Castanea mollissima]
MCKCRSHGTFSLFGLQSSHLNICYYHQDLHRWPRRSGLRPRFCSDRRALLLIGPRICPDGRKIKVSRQCNPQGDPANQLPCALRVYWPVDSHTCQTPWFVFQDGTNGESVGQCQERIDAEARREARAASHDCSNDDFVGITTVRAWVVAKIRIGPRSKLIGRSAVVVPHPTGVHRRPSSASFPTISSTL